jgi:hypothetical protein
MSYTTYTAPHWETSVYARKPTYAAIQGMEKKEEQLGLPFEDKVNSPPHYGQGKIECIDYIKDFLTPEEFIGYLRGNIAKYLHRFRYKNGIEDLKKAEWYLKYLTQFLQEQGIEK